MLSRNLIRTSTRALRSAGAAVPRQSPHNLPAAAAFLSTNTPTNLPNKDRKQEPGAFARTDETITVEYPEEGELPSSQPVTGRGGMHMKRTLGSFSLEGKVGLVTGGARGLGLVMGQGMVISGANLAIVDMNSESPSFTNPSPRLASKL
jgi:D-arabinitol 2-dehydrogenase